MDVLGLLVPFLLSSAGITALVAIISGIAKLRAERQPRQRVAAIRAATDLLALLKVGTVEHVAVEQHLHEEAQALKAILDAKNSRRARRRTTFERTALATSIAAAVVTIGIGLVVTIANPPEPSPPTETGFSIPEFLATLAGVAVPIGLVGYREIARWWRNRRKRKHKD